jgi:hypothetical protein
VFPVEPVLDEPVVPLLELLPVELVVPKLETPLAEPKLPLLEEVPEEPVRSVVAEPVPLTFVLPGLVEPVAPRPVLPVSVLPVSVVLS